MLHVFFLLLFSVVWRLEVCVWFVWELWCLRWEDVAGLWRNLSVVYVGGKLRLFLSCWFIVCLYCILLCNLLHILVFDLWICLNVLWGLLGAFIYDVRFYCFVVDLCSLYNKKSYIRHLNCGVLFQGIQVSSSSKSNFCTCIFFCGEYWFSAT